MVAAYRFGGEWKKIIAPLSKSRLPYEEPRNDWQEAKARADTNNGEFWRLYNKLYDLSEYMDKHPGGREWLEFTRGTDCTEAFEAHHLDFEKVEKILKLYYIREANDGGYAQELSCSNVAPTSNLNGHLSGNGVEADVSNPVKLNSNNEFLQKELLAENGVARGRVLFSVVEENNDKTEEYETGDEKKNPAAPSSRMFLYDENNFYSTLRRKVKEELLRSTGAENVLEATGPTNSMRLACAAVVSQFFLVHHLAARTGSKLLSALAGLMLIGCWGVGHNFMHQSDKQAGYWRYALDLTPLSSHAQRMTHALSHHLYPNMYCDIECYSLEDLLPFIPGVPKNTNIVVKNAYPAILFLAGIQGVFGKLIVFMNLMKRKGIGAMSLAEKAYILPMFQLFNYVKLNGIRNGLKLFSIQMGVLMMAFVPIGLSVHHSTEEDKQVANGALKPRAWHEGMPGAQDKFGEHQVAATSDHSVWLNDGSFLGNYLSLTLFAYLNDHTAHHLFPSVDHSKHSIYRQTMLSTFHQYGVPYRTNSVISLLRGFHTFVTTRTIAELSQDIRNVG